MTKLKIKIVMLCLIIFFVSIPIGCLSAEWDNKAPSYIKNNEVKVLFILFYNPDGLGYYPNWESMVEDSFFEDKQTEDGIIPSVESFFKQYISYDWKLSFHEFKYDASITTEEWHTSYKKWYVREAKQALQLFDEHNIIFGFMPVKRGGKIVMNSEFFFEQVSESNRRYVIAHEFAHWFGAFDAYPSSLYYDENDPDNDNCIMSYGSFDPSTLNYPPILGQRQLDGIIYDGIGVGINWDYTVKGNREAWFYPFYESPEESLEPLTSIGILEISAYAESKEVEARIMIDGKGIIWGTPFDIEWEVGKAEIIAKYGGLEEIKHVDIIEGRRTRVNFYFKIAPIPPPPYYPPSEFSLSYELIIMVVVTIVIAISLFPLVVIKKGGRKRGAR